MSTLASDGSRTPGRAAVEEPPVLARTRRVLVLVAAIAVLSLADLHITLTYLRSVGMGEANPIARFVMQQGSPAVLAAWKVASVVFACLIFVLFRRRRSAEVACWACFLLLIWLTLRWISYSDNVSRITGVLHVLSETDAHGWVRFDP